MKTHTDYLTFETKRRQEIIDITDSVEACRSTAGIREGMVLASAMHISASVFVNDHEPNLWKDILDWLEESVAPWDPERYRHNSGTGEDNAAAHLRSITIGHEVIVPVTAGRLDRAVAADLLWRVGRATTEARDSQSYGRLRPSMALRRRSL
jgi:secondary thiamine-phosphate synthase enzyme